MYSLSNCCTLTFYDNDDRPNGVCMFVCQINAEKTNRQLDNDVSLLNSKLNDSQRELREATAQRTRSQQELNDATNRIADLANQLAQSNKIKSALNMQVEELKKSDDAESAARSRVSKQANLAIQIIEVSNMNCRKV